MRRFRRGIADDCRHRQSLPVEMVAAAPGSCPSVPRWTSPRGRARTRPRLGSRSKRPDVWRFFYPWPVLRHPASDRLVVALDGTTRRPLAAPAHLAQHFPDMAGMIGDARVASITSATRCRVQRSVAYPWPSGPLLARPRRLRAGSCRVSASAPPDLQLQGRRCRQPANRSTSGWCSGATPRAHETPRPASCLSRTAFRPCVSSPPTQRSPAATGPPASIVQTSTKTQTMGQVCQLTTQMSLYYAMLF